jgi:putative radical SAM enzyme (TIGR03279 family)
VARAGIKLVEVMPGSCAHRMGLSPGDEILSINGHPVPDELALKFHLAEEAFEMEVRRADGSEASFEAELSEGEVFGVVVEDFKTRTCNNACLFCFIDQLPQGVRETLKVKDDDYRLSFLHGNYITLTNLPERELDRIIGQRLSPLYVSVHATDPELRTRMLGRKKQDDLDRKLRKLIDGGIELHTQIVLMPELNDGANLERTVFDLYSRFPGVDSVAVVPLGLSDHGRPKEVFAPVTPSYCRGIVAQMRPWQERFRQEIGRTFAYLADEFYIQGGLELPDAGYYDGFAQIEDGVGMVRRFLDDFDAELKRRRRPLTGLRGTLVTARLFHPFLSECISRLNARLGSRLEIRLAVNRYMGSSITVAGLLSGGDILAALEGIDPGAFVVIPHEAVSRVDGILVDNLPPAEMARRLGRPVLSSGRTVRDFFGVLATESRRGLSAG